MMARALLVLALVAPLGGCVSSAELEDARVAERQAEQRIERIEALPADDPDRAELLAQAIAVEAEKEQIRKELEAASRDGLISRGLEIAGETATGNYPAAGETLLGGLGLLLAFYWRARKKGKEELDQADQKLIEVMDDKLAAAERRRDETRQAQGLAPASVRSAEAAKSAVARAAALVAEQDIERQVDAILARRIAQTTPPGSSTPPMGAAPTAPAPPAARTHAGYYSAPIVPVPDWPERPTDLGGQA